MGKGEVKLLGAWASPFVMRPRIALNIKSVEYEFIEETMHPKSELLLKSNPVHKKIPVLLHHDKPICESLNIVQYIDEAFSSGPFILPSDPHDRAIQRFWAAYVDDLWLQSFSGVARPKGEEAKAEALEQLRGSFLALEGALEKCGKGEGFFGGHKIGYVDIALGSFLGWLRLTEVTSHLDLLDEAKTPGLVAWAERFCADDAVKGVMPETHKLLEFVKMLEARKQVEATSATD